MEEQIKPKYTTKENTVYLWKLWWKWDKKSILWSLVQIPCDVITPLTLVLLLRVLVDAVSSAMEVKTLVFTVVALIGTYGLMGYLSKQVEGSVMTASVKNRWRMNALLFDKVMDMDYQCLEALKSRQMLERAQNCVGAEASAGRQIVYTTIQLGVNGVGIVTFSAILTKVHWLVVVGILTTAAITYLVEHWMTKKQHALDWLAAPLWRKRQYLNSDKPAEIASGKDIRLYHLDNWFEQLYTQIFGENKKFSQQTVGIVTKGTALLAVLILLRDGGVYTYLIFMVLNGKLSAADFAFYFGVVAGFSNWTTQMITSLNALDSYALQCDDYRKFLELPDVMTREGGAPLPVGNKNACSIVFEHLSFRYDAAEKDVLKDINLTVNPGEKIALVGMNGAGKTTCMKLLCGLYLPTGGRILINGTDIADFNRDAYYGLFSAVFQEALFLPATVEENIALCEADEIDRTKLNRVLEQAGLSEKTTALPTGTKTLLNRELFPDAVEFSGGEFQKLLLARALYKDAPVIILDEPTAALDPIAEDQMYQKYHSFTEGKTSFYISHRLASTRFCDQILFLQDGIITEIGTHEALMEKRGSYYEMFEMQSHYYKSGEAQVPESMALEAEEQL